MTADPDDIAALRADDDLVSYLLSLTVSAPTKPKPAAAEPEKPCYHIRRPGAWPCGTAATGPTPPTCTDCSKETRRDEP